MIYREDIERLLPLYLLEQRKLRAKACDGCSRCHDFHGTADEERCKQANAQREQ